MEALLHWPKDLVRAVGFQVTCRAEEGRAAGVPWCTGCPQRLAGQLSKAALKNHFQLRPEQPPSGFELWCF